MWREYITLKGPYILTLLVPSLVSVAKKDNEFIINQNIETLKHQIDIYIKSR